MEPISLQHIASLVDGLVIGDTTLTISTLSSIDNIIHGALVFAEGDENIARAEASEAAAVLVRQQHPLLTKKPMILVSNPFHAFIKLLSHFYPSPSPKPGIHPSALIKENVHIGKEVFIGPYVIIEEGASIGDYSILKGHVYIGAHVSIGKNCTIHPHVTLYDHCKLGDRVIIHASTVIGSDGFGYTFAEGQHIKVPHVGYVQIEDDVEIGANTVIDRATLDATIIGKGTKIDNLVQIAHSVKLGQHNILCAFTGIAGSTTSGDNVLFAANVGVSDHVKIDDGVILGARAGVPPKKHLRQGNIYLGSPARPKDKAIEQELASTRIPLMRKNIKQLSEKINEISKFIESVKTQDAQ